MKKIALTSLIALGVVASAHAGAINDNPLYMPTAGTFYSVSAIETDTAFEGMGIGTAFGYGVTDQLSVEVNTSVALYDDFNEASWANIGLGAAYRALSVDNWRLDVLGALNIMGDNWYDKDYNLYTWSAGVRGGYVANDWTLAGSVVYNYTNTEMFNWGDKGFKHFDLGLAGQYLIDNNWNVVAGLNYILPTESGIDDELFAKVGVNYNFTDDMYLGVYVTRELIVDNDDKEWGLGVKFGAQF